MISIIAQKLKTFVSNKTKFLVEIFLHILPLARKRKIYSFLAQSSKHLFVRILVVFFFTLLIVSLAQQDKKYYQLIGKRENTSFTLVTVDSFLGSVQPYVSVHQGKAWASAISDVVNAARSSGMGLSISFDPVEARGVRANPTDPFIQDGYNGISFVDMGTLSSTARTVPFFSSTNFDDADKTKKILEADIALNGSLISWLPKNLPPGQPEDPRRIKLSLVGGMFQYYDPATIIAHEFTHSLGFNEPPPFLMPEELSAFNSLTNRLWIGTQLQDNKIFPQYSPDKNFSSYSQSDKTEFKALYPVVCKSCCKTQIILAKSGEIVDLPILNTGLFENIRQQILEPWVAQNYSSKQSPISYLINSFNIEEEDLIKILAHNKALIRELNSITTKHIDILESQITSSPRVFSKNCINDIEKFIDLVSQNGSEDIKHQLSLVKLSLPQLENKTFQQFLNQTPLSNNLMSKLHNEIEKYQNPKAVSVTIRNFPNPSNDKTVLSYTLPEATYLTIKILDIHGKELQVPEKGIKNMGNYELDINTTQMASGVYICTIETLKEKITHKIIVQH